MISGAHIPVLEAEAVTALQPHPGGRYLDGTIGWGGHAAAILKASAPDGWLFGCDRDGAAIEAARERLAEFAGRFELRQARFDELDGWIGAVSCDGVVLDLGVSSAQLDQAERGFSFQRDGPLDMRMDRRQTMTAADWLERTPVPEMARVFREWGDEPRAGRIARAIDRARQRARLETTLELAGLVERVAPRRGRRLHPATRVFQAIRMAVNDELGSLRRGLVVCWGLMKRGARVAVITFHSAEARVVKEFGRERERPYVVPGGVDVPELRQARAPELKRVTRKALRPSAAEVSSNPRARSAELRVFEKYAD